MPNPANQYPAPISNAIVIFNHWTGYVAHVLSIRVRKHLTDEIFHASWYNHSVATPKNSVHGTDVSCIKPTAGNIREKMLVSKEISLAADNFAVENAMASL